MSELLSLSLSYPWCYQQFYSSAIHASISIPYSVFSMSFLSILLQWSQVLSPMRSKTTLERRLTCDFRFLFLLSSASLFLLCSPFFSGVRFDAQVSNDYCHYHYHILGVTNNSIPVLSTILFLFRTVFAMSFLLLQWSQVLSPCGPRHAD